MSDTIALVIALLLPVAMLGGGAWVKSVIDQVLEHRRQRGQPICGCGHHFSFHEPGQQICKQRTREVAGFDRHGDEVFEVRDCACQQYSGPMPQIDYRIVKELGGGEPKET